MGRRPGGARGRAASRQHAGRPAQAREALDAFAPDLVVILGDDRYENFKEDIIPRFCVLAYDDLVLRPWADAQESAMMSGKPNVWGEPGDTEFKVRCHREAAKHIARGLLKAEFDVAYAYRPLHRERCTAKACRTRS
jgi:hypothetical protein